MNKTIKLTVLSIALITGLSHADDSDIQTTDEILGDARTNIRADDVPAGAHGRGFIPGMSFGDDSIQGASYSNNLKVDASFRAYANLSCSNFDFSNIANEIQRQVESITEKAQRIPDMVVGAAGAAVSTLPNYVLAKFNPTLYQLLQKGIDEYTEILNIATKSCQDIENEIAANPDGNPYQNLIKVAVADQWKRNVDTYNTSSESMESLQENTEEEAKKAGVVLADGKSYGGEDQEPINFTKSIVIAGVNLLIGRDDKDQWEQDFAITDSNTEMNPIYKSFKSPDELYEFVKDIYGTTETMLVDSADGQVKRYPGRGYEKKYLEIRNGLYPLIKQRVYKEISRKDFEKQTGIIIAPAMWDDIRGLPKYETAVEMEALTKREAIKDLKEKLVFVKSAIRAGVYSPDLQTSSTREQAEAEYKMLYYRIVDDIAEIQQRMYSY